MNQYRANPEWNRANIAPKQVSPLVIRNPVLMKNESKKRWVFGLQIALYGL